MTPLLICFPQIITGLQNFDRDNVASVVTAADKVGNLDALFLLFFFKVLNNERLFSLVL